MSLVLQALLKSNELSPHLAFSHMYELQSRIFDNLLQLKTKK